MAYTKVIETDNFDIDNEILNNFCIDNIEGYSANEYAVEPIDLNGKKYIEIDSRVLECYIVQDNVQEIELPVSDEI